MSDFLVDIGQHPFGGRVRARRLRIGPLDEEKRNDKQAARGSHMHISHAVESASYIAKRRIKDFAIPAVDDKVTSPSRILSPASAT